MEVQSNSYIERVINEVEAFDGERWIDEFETMTKDGERVQEEVLKKILEQNGETEYLNKHGLKGRTDPLAFKNCVPLITYEDIEPYIDRIASGDTSSILTTQPITSFSASSGTSGGKRKLIPYPKEKMDSNVISKLTSYAYRSRKYPIDESKKILMLLHLSPKMKTKGGFDTAPGTSFFFNDPRTKLCYRAEFCCPIELLCASDAEQATYCQLLCGLIYRDEIQYIASAFAHTIVIAFETLRRTWQELCSDIRDGVLSSRITDPILRDVMSKYIKQDPGLADAIYRICEGFADHCWQGLMPKLFPSTKYVLAIMTGSTQKYLGRLRVFAGDLPLFSEDYVSSEGRIGVNTNPNVPPELTTYVVLPNVGYFEFLPVKNLQDGSEIELGPLGLTEVKLGEEYEVVITNFAGIYRYKLGDVVKVVGFFNSTPELQYICRANVILSINADKTTEKDLQEAVEAAASELLVEDNSKLVDYTSYAEVSPGNEHYVIFWEVNYGNASDRVLRRCCNRLDSALPYVKYRMCKAIGPLELRIVRGGTFMKIPEHLMRIGISTNQFKMPKCLKNEQLLKIFNDNVVRSYFSTAFD